VKQLLLVALLVLATTAYAGEDEHGKLSYRAVVDRVDVEPASLTGYRLRVYLSALALQGQLLDLTDPKSIKLYLGSSEKKLPYALGRYDATNGDTAIVIMVQASLDYSDVVSHIGESLDRDLLAQLGDRTQVAVLKFGETAGTGKLAPIKSVRGKVSLSSDNSAGDPALLDTLDRALRLLRKAKTTPEGRPLRKMVVIVGDGRDLAGDRDRVTRAGNRAARDGVRIHTIAYSASDARRSMLALGELSKRSLGTFRWVRTAAQDSWKAAFEQLRDEINKQYVLTYFVGAGEDLAGKKLHIVTVGRTETTSNELKIPPPSCGGSECTSGYCANDTCLQYRDAGERGVLGWLVLVGGIGLGAALVLGVIGYFITRRQQRVQPPPGMPGQPMMPGQPGIPGQPAMPGHPTMPGPHVPQQPIVGQPAAMPAAVPTGKQKKPKKGQAPVVPPGFLPNGRPIPALLITSGPRRGERHLLCNGFLIGKQPGCNLILEDGYTSSQHAQIAMDEHGTCKLYDRGSTNGTYVNGVRVSESPLHHGLTIKIGTTDMVFLAE
jgi:hypothetical protein